jgi:ABC-type bacteriocin/lantibiotic exporter with double-glycine peptidase domain
MSAAGDDNRCGPRSLTICGEALGVVESAARIETCLPPTGQPFSLKEIQQAARQLGLDTRAVQWTAAPADFTWGTAAAVLPIQRPGQSPHFVALLAVHGEAMTLLDDPHPPVVISATDLRTRWGWDGSALYIARDSAAWREVLPRSRTSGSLLLYVAGAGCLGVGLFKSLRTDTNDEEPMHG